MTDHRESALNFAGRLDLLANLHALIYVGDQIARVATALEPTPPTDNEKLANSSQATLDLTRAGYELELARYADEPQQSTAQLRQALRNLDVQQANIDYTRAAGRVADMEAGLR